LRTLVLGGTRSGKSAYAESLLDPKAPVRYLATLRVDDTDPGDSEMAERIRRHRERRPDHWRVVTTGADLAPALHGVADGEQVLLDGLTLWLADVLGTDAEPTEAINAAVAALLQVPDLIVVSDEVGGGLVPENPLARRFRDLAGEMHQKLAAGFDRVVLVTAGLPLELKSANATGPANDA
jgi:adenosylcobinamide kinase/adenosylcobinamide-phosphate guanylyltransferase